MVNCWICGVKMKKREDGYYCTACGFFAPEDEVKRVDGTRPYKRTKM